VTVAERARLRENALKRAEEFSPFLRELLRTRPEIGDRFLADGSEAAMALGLAAEGGRVEAELRRRRHGLALAVALGDLAGELSLEEVTACLSRFADEAIDRSLRVALDERVPGAELQGIGAVALGKLGSHELNYSSDVDLLLLFDPERMPRRQRDDPGEAAVRIGRRLIELLQKRTEDGYVARVDLRLRPSPEVTPIVLPVNAAISYYESSALPWERAAFIRGRAAAGDKSLGQHFLKSIQPFVWRRSLDFGVVEELRQISARIRDHFAHSARFGPGFDLKRGRGGIREAEFFTQIQQMIHGGRDVSVRAPATLDALTALERAGRLSTGEASDVATAYRLFRTIEHRAQMVADAQTHLLPVERGALDGVARLHGIEDGEALLDLLRPHVERVGTMFDALAPEVRDRLSTEPDVLLTELAELGFHDPLVAAKRIADWRSGRSRSLRSPAAQEAFEAMLPGLLRAIAAGPDPEEALNRFADVTERLSSGINLYRLLEARPHLAELLARILAHAPTLSEQLSRRPELLDGLLDASTFDPPPDSAQLAEELLETMHDQPYDVALDRVRQLVNEKRFALGVQLVDAREDPLDIAAGYARVAEGTVVALATAAAREFERMHGKIAGGELVILGLGRLGGRALTHASDLDLIYLHTAPPHTVSDGVKPLGPNNYFNRLANRVTAALSVPTAAGRLYEVDLRLRPQGSKGMLVVPLDAFADYQRHEAWTWEHMALTRARPVFGSPEVREKASAFIGEILRLPREARRIAADASRMRDDMAKHKPPTGVLDVKLGRGGLVDLEFAIHVLQLTRHQGLSTNLDKAVEGLVTAGLVDGNIIEAQHLLTRMLVTLRLVAPHGGEPTDETCELVAAACRQPSWKVLLEAHDEARQSIAALWQRVKGEAEC
jgi:glutamate-ammonia-ligase adenylyltransferase